MQILNKQISSEINPNNINPLFPHGLKACNSKLSIKTAYNLLLSICDQKSDKGCIREEELAELLKASALKKFSIRAYDGFEPSGRMHIAQGLLKTINVNKMTASGVSFTFLVADWFAQLNNKFGGDLKKIRAVGEYFIEVWKSCGMELSLVEFLWSSEEINKRPEEYWSMVMDIARKNSVSRIKRCGQIMGRQSNGHNEDVSSLLSRIHLNRAEDAQLPLDAFVEKYRLPEKSDSQPVAQLLYPLMQCADIFFLKANICQLGLDQLKVNVLAREYCDGRGSKAPRLHKPVVLSHPMLMGLKEGQEKMSKSDPDSAIFMEDSAEEVQRKIRRAFCRPGDTATNPVLDYLEKIVFNWHLTKQALCEEGAEFIFEVKRDGGNGGDAAYTSFAAVAEDFAGGRMHPADLKEAVARELNILLEPVRRHFSEGRGRELLRKIKAFK